MPASRVVMAIDGGGSSTTACIASADAVLAELTGPASNPAQVGVAGCLEALTVVAQAVMQQAQAPRLDEVVVGLAGIEAIDCAADIVQKLQEEAGLHSVRVVTDIELLLLAASGPTVALVSGTGSVCIGRDNAQRIKRVGGRGYLVGDEGSGYWLGQQALAAALRGAEQLGPPTALTRIAAERFMTNDVAAWTQAIYLAPNPRQVIASFAPEVPAAAAAGDTPAEQILERASKSLAQHVESVVESLAISGGTYTLVLAGSVLVHTKALRHALSQKLQAAGIAPATTSVITSPAQSAAVERGHSTSPP